METRGATMLAAQIWDLADADSQHALDVADAVINRLAIRPGQRDLVLVSPRFLSATQTRGIDALIDRALSRGIVVNAIDAAGLYVKTRSDPILMGRGDLQVMKFRMENEGLTSKRDVLASLTDGTGGEFFHNSNDLNQAFEETAQLPEASYVLKLFPAGCQIGWQVSPVESHGERRSWLASAGPARLLRGGCPARQTVQVRGTGAPGLFAGASPGPAVRVTAQMEKTSDTLSAITVKIHVEVRDVPFTKAGDRNVNILTFNTALFDHDGKYLTGKES